MSKFQYQVILFYTSRSNDTLSYEILNELQNNQNLNDQIKKICVSNPSLKLPKIIVERDTFPIIVVRGFNKPIEGEHALSWIKEGHFSGKANGLDYGDLDKTKQTSDDFGTLAVESSNTEYHQAFNEEYNRDGVDLSTHVVNSTFSHIDDSQNIDTFEEQKNARAPFSQLDQIREQRAKEISQPLQRIGNNPALSRNIPPMNNNNPYLPMSQHPSMPLSQNTSNPFQHFPPSPPTNTLNQPPMNPNSAPVFPPQVQQPFSRQFSSFSQPPQQSPQQPPQQPLQQPPPNSNRTVPMLPSGFGNIASYDNAYNGQSLLSHNPIQTQFHTRRDKCITPCLPTGRAWVGPNNSVNTIST